MTTELPDGVLRIEHFAYNGKSYQAPIFDTADPVILTPQPAAVTDDVRAEPVITTLNTVWDLARFREPRRPVSLGILRDEELAELSQPGATRVLDMPIKFPDIAEYRLPRAFRQFASTIQRIVDFEHAVNPQHADYHAYLTIDQEWVKPGQLHREAPCHVDGFQGARWNPKCKTNHTYTVSDLLPTAYYPQPFDFTGLDERVHDFFWEMNAQVADTNEAHRWQPREAEITMMDCYCVHRGVEATQWSVYRTWLRVSFEERRRIFDRLGNAHNPLFDYAWEMVVRDIEQLHLIPFRADSDPTLRVFPWQDASGKPLPKGAPKTKPRLRR
ncbi:MAG: hypothetical protein H0T79_14575 [Deltaproteobacteria bacterium]|nr:hypothetical protein [Deltaproteobacteria bacterium]